MDDLLTLRDVAERLGVHRNTLRKYIASQALPVVQLGPRTTRVRRSDLEMFVKERVA